MNWRSACDGVMAGGVRSPGQRMPVALYCWGPAQSPSVIGDLCPALHVVWPFMPSRLHPVLHLSMSRGEGEFPYSSKGEAVWNLLQYPTLKCIVASFWMDARSMIPAGS